MPASGGLPRKQTDVTGGHRIPVTVTSSLSPNETLENIDDPFSDVSYQMDHEVERVLREWDTNTKKITHNNFRLRPTVSSSTPNSPFSPRRKRFSNSLSNLSHSTDFGNSPRRTFEFPEINVSRRQDATLNSSVESLTEELKSPLYTTCPKTGQRLLKMEFDTEDYSPENITVKIAENKLVIHALQNEMIGGRKSSTEFCRKIKLPSDVNSRLLKCYFDPSNKKLVAEAPTLRSMYSSTTSVSSSQPNPTPFSPTPKPEVMNLPYVQTNSFGRVLFINVEVGKVFQPDDVTVKVKGDNKVIVSADRIENTDTSKLTASLYREFALPDRIQPKTLKAGFSKDGILKISALLIENSQEAGNINVELLQNGNGLGKDPRQS